MEILKFEQYNQELNEGWKINILVSLLSLLGVETMGHNIKDDRHLTTHTHLKNTADSFLKNGWKLDSTQIDTLYSDVILEKPETIVMYTSLSFDKDHFFESGKFTLTQDVTDSIQHSMIEMADNQNVLLKVEVTSSTDKQLLSTRLKELLKSKGYTADNQGLSKARADQVKSYLVNVGVNDSLITVDDRFEQGEGTIDESARFVSVVIYYLHQDLEEILGKKDTIMKTKPTYFLSKDVSYKHQHIRGGNKEIKKLGPIKNFKNVKALKCSSFGSRY